MIAQHIPVRCLYNFKYCQCAAVCVCVNSRNGMINEVINTLMSLIDPSLI